mmetsp:Transcript_104924/g.306446  ORF Transcript_104924/g.306446 Transcript_104924/m.306446 type:complete len:833 (+) Transcript_104924:62-2560(+)
MVAAEPRSSFEDFLREQLDLVGRSICAEYRRRLPTAAAGRRESAAAAPAAEETGGRSVCSEGPPKAAPLPTAAAADGGRKCGSADELDEQPPSVANQRSQSKTAGKGTAKASDLQCIPEVPSSLVGKSSPVAFALSCPARPAREVKWDVSADNDDHPLAVPAAGHRACDAGSPEAAWPRSSKSQPPTIEVPKQTEPPPPQAPSVKMADCRSNTKASVQTPQPARTPKKLQTPVWLEPVLPGTPIGRSNTMISESCRSNASKRSLLGISNAVNLDGSIVDDLLFTVLPLWSQAVPTVVSKMGSIKEPPSSPRTSISSSTGSQESADVGWWPLPVVSPNALQRLVWDVMGILCILYDALVAPLEFLEVSQVGFIIWAGWFTRVFWPLDIVASFHTGVQLSDGSMELRRKLIAKRYLFSWFLPDVILIAADWMEVILDGAGKASQLMGPVRMLRLVRLLRLKKINRVVVEKAASERSTLLFSVVNSLGAILGIAHALACAWLALGRRGQGSWAVVLGLQEDQYFEQYITALHWSLANFAGSMEVTPQNPVERCFAICSLLVGFFLASWFVSNITSSMTRLSMLASKNSMEFAVLNKFMREHGISGGLARRVQLNAKHVIAEKEQHLQEDSVELLGIVSEPLRAEVHLEIHSPGITCHPLFYRMRSSCLRAMQQLCHVGVSVVTLEEGDYAFTRGEVPSTPKMLFVLSGILEYTQDGENVTSVTCGQWASEQVLWTDWVYHGNLQAANTCRILVLDAQTFWQVCGPGQLGRLEVGKYAGRFVQWQNSSPGARSDIGNGAACLWLLHEAYGDQGRRASQASMSSWLGQRRSSLASVL